MTASEITTVFENTAVLNLRKISNRVLGYKFINSLPQTLPYKLSQNF